MKGSGLLTRLRATPQWVGDVSLAAVVLIVVAGLLLAAAATRPSDPDIPWLRNVPLVMGLCVVGVTPILIRRWVWASAVLVAAIAVAAVPLVGSNTTEAYSLLVVIYTAAVRLPPPRAVGATAIVSAGIALACVEANANVVVWMANGVFVVIPFAIGSVVRTRRAYIAALEQRAIAAETTRELTARDAVLAERQRIARELHDVVAHHISVMGVMAAAARRTLRTNPEVADEALGTIEDTGRSTLREMRRLLDVLRDEKDPSLPTTPQPGLPGLEALVHQVGEAGLTVRLRVEGEPMPLDSGVDLTLFRIVQEALTNTLKHAGPTSADVVVRYGPADVEVTVSDNGRGPAGANIGGHGLVGMRERVGLYAGSLYTGPGPAGGFTVRATVPFDRPAHTKGISA
ncbi:sensor histidine kinase [Fodinicola acaciae]|uniref:sensor histidine kinase n=1 Tax=Fodinicola acaciae TaxID=2681555 RepID=UPI0013D5A2A7|nr:sensor histidine kinase [Fodinicola acaciae]